MWDRSVELSRSWIKIHPINLHAVLRPTCPPIEPAEGFRLLRQRPDRAAAIQLTGAKAGSDSATPRQTSRETPDIGAPLLRRRTRCRMSNCSRSGSSIRRTTTTRRRRTRNPSGTGPEVGGPIDKARSSDLHLRAGCGELSPRGRDRRTRHARSPSTPPRVDPFRLGDRARHLTFDALRRIGAALRLVLDIRPSPGGR
jgi:hypothetical protein